MKKTALVLLAFAFIISGCAGTNWNIPAGNTAMGIGIKLTAYNAGYYVGKSKTPTDDDAVALFYKAAREGVIDAAKAAKVLADLKIENPQLSGSLMVVLTEMGVTFDTNGIPLGLDTIPVAYWDKAAEGYALGYEMGKVGQKGVAQSAVLKYLPKKK